MYKETLSFLSNNLETYLNTMSFPNLTKEKGKTLDGGITEKELFIELQNMENNKSPGNDGLTKEFYITFWNKVKAALLLAVEKAYLVKQLSTSQKLAVIKLIEKKGRDKRYIQNWRPISLLNVDVKRRSTKNVNKEGFLVTTNIEKVFDFVNHHFLIAILEKKVLGLSLLNG